MASFAALFLISCLSLHFGQIDLAALSSYAYLCGFLVPLLHLIVGLPFLGGNIGLLGLYYGSVLVDFLVTRSTFLHMLHAFAYVISIYECFCICFLHLHYVIFLYEYISLFLLKKTYWTTNAFFKIEINPHNISAMIGLSCNIPITIHKFSPPYASYSWQMLDINSFSFYDMQVNSLDVNCSFLIATIMLLII